MDKDVFVNSVWPVTFNNQIWISSASSSSGRLRQMWWNSHQVLFTYCGRKNETDVEVTVILTFNLRPQNFKSVHPWFQLNVCSRCDLNSLRVIYHLHFSSSGNLDRGRYQNIISSSPSLSICAKFEEIPSKWYQGIVLMRMGWKDNLGTCVFTHLFQSLKKTVINAWSLKESRTCCTSH